MNTYVHALYSHKLNKFTLPITLILICSHSISSFAESVGRKPPDIQVKLNVVAKENKQILYGHSGVVNFVPKEASTPIFDYCKSVVFQALATNPSENFRKPQNETSILLKLSCLQCTLSDDQLIYKKLLGNVTGNELKGEPFKIRSATPDMPNRYGLSIAAFKEGVAEINRIMPSPESCWIDDGKSE